jgi:hypothetical protein
MKRFALSLLLLFGTLAFAGESVLYSFQGGSDGYLPVGGLVSDQNGNLYGVTEYGGTGSCLDGTVAGCGIVFELSPDGKGGWTETVIYTFTGGADGQYPLYGLILDNQGNLYGTTEGLPSLRCSPTCGSVFELSPGASGWSINVLHAFRGKQDGGILQGGVLMDSAGHLYGTTSVFGPKGNGTTFELSNSGRGWTLKTLHAFGESPDGKQPGGLLVLSPNGTIYGTTQDGGTTNLGVFYSLSLNKSRNWTERVLYSFQGGKDGSDPIGLTADLKGNLYGVSPDEPFWGDVFQFSRNLKGNWVKKTLYTFRPPHQNGPEDPNGPVSIDQSGNIYGTTSHGGPFPGEAGTVYELTPPKSGYQWSEALIFVFPSNGTYGDTPTGQLLLDGKGNIYGVTELGGNGCSGGCGTVFEMTP